METRLKELFDAELNLEDKPFTTEELAAAVARADVLVPTVTDRVDGRVLSRAGGALAAHRPIRRWRGQYRRANRRRAASP